MEMMSTHHQPNLWWSILSLALACISTTTGHGLLAGEPGREELPPPRASANSSNQYEAALYLPVRDIPRELSELVEHRASPRELLEFLEPILLQGQMAQLPAAPQLAWSTWPYPGWRWEYSFSATERLILASDRGMLVVIRHIATRQGAKIEMSASDLSALGALRGRSRLGHSSSQAHVSSASVAQLARKSPTLFTWYYYFAGPTAEIVSSDLLPPPPIDLLR